MSESHQVGSSELGRWRTKAHVQENFSEPASWRKAHSWTSAILFLQEEEEFNCKYSDFFAYYLSLKWVDRIVGHWWFLFALGCQGIPPSQPTCYLYPVIPTDLNPLSRSIHIQILQTDLHTFPYRMSWENLIKDQGIFTWVIILLILITYLLTMYGYC